MSESTDLHDKIAQLEHALGQKQIKVDLLEKMIDLAEEGYNLNLNNSQHSTKNSPLKK